MLKNIDPRLLIVLGAVLFSTGGAAVKGTTLSGWQVAGFRSGVACLTLFLLLPQARRGFSWRVVPVAVSYAAVLTFYVLANKLTTAANTIFLQSTAPLYLLVLSPLVLKERIRRQDLWFMVALAIGLSLFFVSIEAPSVSAPAPLMGNLLGACAGVSWALTLLGLRWLAKHPDNSSPVTAAALGNLFAFLICAGWAFPVAASAPADWLLIAYLGVFQIGLAYVFVTAAIHRITAFEASLFVLVEPVLNPVWAWLILGEAPAALALLAGAMILMATIVRTLQKRDDVDPT